MQYVEREGFAGLNSDDEDRVIPKGDYRYALNIRNGSSDTSNVGAVENLKGTTLVEYNLPNGEHKVVGVYEDEINNCVLYLVWSDEPDVVINSKEGPSGNTLIGGIRRRIMRYSIDTNTIEELARSDYFDWEKDSNIHSIDLVGDLFYWTDGDHEPKKVNISKCNYSPVPRITNIYFSKDYEDLFDIATVHGTLTVVDRFNNDTYQVTIPSFGGSGLTLESATTLIAKGINDQVEGMNSIVAEGCGDFLQIRFLNPGNSFINVTLTEGDWRVVPDNYYTVFNTDVTDQIKASPACQPKVELTSDPERDVNYLLKKTFQFAVRYVFDDYEKTVLSPYSDLIYLEEICGTINRNNNGIRVYFDDNRLLDEASLSVIKQVEICFREGNTGKWRLAKTINQPDFGLQSSDHYFDFYNDQAYPFLPEIEANTLFHSVPKKSETQEFVENRLFHGNITHGFDPVCVEAEIDVSYNDPQAEVDTYSVIGEVSIRNPFKENSFQDQVIWQLDDGVFQFGGLDNDNKKDTAGIYGQEIPLGGFVVYLAGTDYYAITVQDIVGDVETIGNQNVYDGRNNGKRGKIRDAIKESGVIKQRFEIKGVPPGKYKIRVASHKLTEADLRSNRDYQRTSTTLSYMQPSVGTEWDIEVVDSDYDMTESNDQNEWTGFKVIDLSDPGLGNSDAITGYLTEDESNPGQFSTSEKGIELALVAVNSGDNDLGFVSGRDVGNSGGQNKDGNNQHRLYTDHNGFFYITKETAGGNPLEIAQGNCRSLANVLELDIYNSDGSTGSFHLQGKYMDVIMKGANVNLENASIIAVKGKVVNNSGLGIEGVVIVNDYSQWTETDANGNYILRLYGDTYVYNQTGQGTAGRREGVVPLGRKCYAEFEPSEIQSTGIVRVGPPPTPPNYNWYNPYVHDDIILSTVAGENINALKRGGDYTYGLVYRDNGSRMSVVNTDEELQKHIKFYTEADQNGGQERFGHPSLTWAIKHKAPKWATNYQWVRTKNESLLDYLQFAVDSVIYKNDNDEETDITQAVKVEFTITNIGSYSEDVNPESVIAIPAALNTEWRVRLIQKSDGSYYEDYYDEALVSGTNSGSLVIKRTFDFEIEPGAMIEIYKPQRSSEEKLYYEIAECYEVVDGLHKGPSKSQKEWQFDDNGWYDGSLGFVSYNNIAHDFEVGDVIDVYQDYPYTNSDYNGKAVIIDIPNAYTIITDKTFLQSTGAEGGLIRSRATGVFKNGDVYYRTRYMPIEDNSLKVTRPVDDKYVSEYYHSEFSSIGRLHIEDALEREVKDEHLVVYGGGLYESDRINEMNVFYDANYENLSREYGPIRKLILTGNNLISVCELRTATLYINEAIITSAEGDDTVTATSSVIGNVRPMQDHFGTVNPESVYEREGKVVYWDANKGAVVQISTNGLFPISSYKMIKHFYDISKELKEGGYEPLVLGVHDQFFNENILCFGSYGDKGAETISYANNSNRWTTFYSYTPDRIASVSMNMISFVNGDVYLHNSNEIHNNFYGVQHTSKINVIANDNPKNMSVFRALSYESNKPWSAPLITVPANDRYKDGMESRLKVGKFVNKEGIFYSELLKDMKTPGFSTPEEALINGRDLRGRVLDVTLESDNTDLTVLFSVNVKSNPSEMSNR